MTQLDYLENSWKVWGHLAQKGEDFREAKRDIFSTWSTDTIKSDC